MKLAISNIAWASEYDDEMYNFLKEVNFSGLEIAPTRIFSENPYQKLREASDFSNKMLSEYGLTICSMQSIWYGMTQNIFASEKDRRELINYTKKAIEFANAIQCKNLVFGCPRNRNMQDTSRRSIALSFFDEVGTYAAEHNTHFSIEPNPPYYNTNFINTTQEAFAVARELKNPGIKVNVDLGTSINYNDTIDFLNENIDLVNHIHISEPMLAPIKKRAIHTELKKLNYEGYFSIEMGNKNDIELVKNTVLYIKEILG